MSSFWTIMESFRLLARSNLLLLPLLLLEDFCLMRCLTTTSGFFGSHRSPKVCKTIPPLIIEDLCTMTFSLAISTCLVSAATIVSMAPLSRIFCKRFSSCFAMYLSKPGCSTVLAVSGTATSMETSEMLKPCPKGSHSSEFELLRPCPQGSCFFASALQGAVLEAVPFTSEFEFKLEMLKPCPKGSCSSSSVLHVAMLGAETTVGLLFETPTPDSEFEFEMLKPCPKGSHSSKLQGTVMGTTASTGGGSATASF